MLFLPVDLFGAYKRGKQEAISDNWTDLQNDAGLRSTEEDIYSKSLSNLFNTATMGDNLTISRVGANNAVLNNEVNQYNTEVARRYHPYKLWETDRYNAVSRRPGSNKLVEDYILGMYSPPVQQSVGYSGYTGGVPPLFGTATNNGVGYTPTVNSNTATDPFPLVSAKLLEYANVRTDKPILYQVQGTNLSIVLTPSGEPYAVDQTTGKKYVLMADGSLVEKTQ